MQFTFLGTGTSQGVPVIGCQCVVCRSSDPRDKRFRTSGLVTCGKTNISIDCGPDFRSQALRADVKNLEAIVFTHEHNDHIIGLDDVRPFNFTGKFGGRRMPLYATLQVQREIQLRFAYAFRENPYPGSPRFDLIEIDPSLMFQIAGIDFLPLEVLHGDLPVLGFRIFDFVYITDAKTIGPETRKKMKGTRTLVVNALHHEPHHAHLNLAEALAFIEEIVPERAYLTHISHRMGLHAAWGNRLPPGVSFAYDGLTIEIPGFNEKS